MKFIFDSNLCIAILNGTAPTRVKIRIEQGQAVGEEYFVPSIVVHELWFGVFRSQRLLDNTLNLTAFLSAHVSELNFDAEDGRVSGEIRAALARRGTPIGPYDVLIAGQALAKGLTLVTANTREFNRVDGLKLVDWTL